MFKRILVPLDGSAIAEHVLETAADLASRTGAALLLAHADTPGNYIYVEGMPVVDESGHPVEGTHERAYLQRLAEQMQRVWHVPVDWRVLREAGASAAEMLSAYADEAGADCIAMTTHGRGGLERLWLGSVADQLVRTTHAPVLLLRPDGEHTILPHLRRVLAPLDGSPEAESILPLALHMADALGAELALLRVVPVAEQAAITSFGIPVVQRGSGVEPCLEAAQHYLEGVAKQLPSRAHKTSTQVTMSGHVAGSILEAAQATTGTLIAMCTHARRGLERLFIGSVADKVLRASAVPLLLYKPGAGE
jgi:nucleotide-binding universal stress UspA family protein